MRRHDARECAGTGLPRSDGTADRGRQRLDDQRRRLPARTAEPVRGRAVEGLISPLRLIPWQRKIRGANANRHHDDAERLLRYRWFESCSLQRRVIQTIGTSAYCWRALPNPERAMDEWLRVLRPGGRLIVVESHADTARSSAEYASIGNRLRFFAGWPREEIEKLFAAHNLVNIASNP